MAKTLQALIDERFGTPTGPTGRAPTVTVATTRTVVLPADPNRLAATIINLGANPVFLMPAGEPSTTQGIRLNANGGGVALLWDEEFFLLGREWAAVTDAGTSVVLRLEVISQ